VKIFLSSLLALLPLAGQAPPDWSQKTQLGSDITGQGFWHGAGLWAGDHHGPATTLTDSLGLGNSLTGEGFHFEGGWRKGNWDLAAEVLGDRTPDGQSFLTLYRSHIWYQGDSGWQGGFEQEPLVWGYGLNGGYTLGQAARPFPRIRVESPMADLHIFSIPLGTWSWQAFMGRLENHPVLSSSMSNPSYSARAIAADGNPEAPFVSGYRVQATFGPLMEFYLNTLVLWGGTLNGQSLTDGYSLGDYATAMLGIKDALTEASADYSNPSVTGAPPPATKARSATEIDVGFRLQTPVITRIVDADASYLYISRGSKYAVWPVKVFLTNPFHYAAKDVNSDLTNLFAKGDPGLWWNTPNRYSAPSLNQPNDTVGIAVTWPELRVGLEYFACVDSSRNGGGFRPFSEGTYVTGFYYHGDPLGTALGGEQVSTSAKVEVDWTPRLTSGTTVIRGFRPFRDNPVDWQQDHPGAVAGKNRFTCLQQTLAWKRGKITTLELGVDWQRQEAVEYMAGMTGNGFAWFGDVTFRWPGRN